MRIRLISRRSALARHQAERVAQALKDCDRDLEVQYLWRNSKGDEVQDVPLSQLGGKNLYVQDLETALLNGEADIAVHSVKDMPALLPEGLVLAAVSERPESRDALVLRQTDTELADTGTQVRIGTSSMRRACQLRQHYPGCVFLPVRGNVDTRLKKLENGEYDALVLAAAGLSRLNHSERINKYLDISLCVPAAGQGAIGVEVCADNSELLSLISQIDDADAGICVRAERNVCAQLGADCHSALGVHADWVDSGSGIRRIRLRVTIANPQSTELLHVDESDDIEKITDLVDRVCAKLLESGSGEWLGH